MNSMKKSHAVWVGKNRKQSFYKFNFDQVHQIEFGDNIFCSTGSRSILKFRSCSLTKPLNHHMRYKHECSNFPLKPLWMNNILEAKAPKPWIQYL